MSQWGVQGTLSYLRVKGCSHGVLAEGERPAKPTTQDPRDVSQAVQGALSYLQIKGCSQGVLAEGEGPAKTSHLGLRGCLGGRYRALCRISESRDVASGCQLGERPAKPTTQDSRDVSVGGKGSSETYRIQQTKSQVSWVFCIFEGKGQSRILDERASDCQS